MSVTYETFKTIEGYDGDGTSISDDVIVIPAAPPYESFFAAYRLPKKESDSLPHGPEIWTAAGQTGTQYTETDSDSPNENEFKIYYSTASSKIGKIVFSSDNAGDTVYATYKSLGSLVPEVYLNKITSELNELQLAFNALVDSSNNVTVGDDKKIYFNAAKTIYMLYNSTSGKFEFYKDSVEPIYTIP